LVPTNCETTEQAARRADRQDARAEAQQRLEQGLDDLRARHDESRQMVERLVGELIETRDIARQAISAAQRPALLFKSGNLPDLPPPPALPPVDTVLEDIDAMVAAGATWAEIDRYWTKREADRAEVWQGYDLELKTWKAECARIEAAANDDRAEPTEQVQKLNLMPSPPDHRSHDATGDAGLISVIQAGVFGRLAAELLRARSDVAREQIAEVGEMLMAELRRQLTAERQTARAEKREAGAMEAVDELGAVEGFRTFLDERRLVQ
jgi:hypothetical protein